MRSSTRTLTVTVSLAAALQAAAPALATTPPLFGVMYRTGSQTSGLGPWLFDVNPATGAASNGRQLNVNIAVGLAVNPATGVMYGLTDQFGRINNQSGTAGKNLVFTVDIPTGACARLGQLDPVDTSSTGPLSCYEGDLAFHPITGVLWGVTTRVDYARLFTVNLATGAGTTVADIVPGTGVQLDLSAIAFDAAGQLWALDTRYPTQPGPAKIYRVNSGTGAIEQVIQTSVTLGTVAGMAFEPGTGRLLVADGDFGGTAKLYRVDFGIGDLVQIGPTGIAIGNSNGLAGLAFGPAPACSGDLDNDGQVSGSDLSILLSQWGTAGTGADLNGDGTVGGPDLAVLLGRWGPCS